LKIALAQYNFHVGNISSNRKKIEEGIRLAEQEDVDILVFPELSLLGYPPLDLMEYDGLIEEIDRQLAFLLSRVGDMLVILGCPTKNTTKGGKPFYNSALAIHKGQIIFRADKTLLPSYDIFDEDRFFQANNQFDLLVYKGKKIALSICEDLWFNEMPFYSLDPIKELAKLCPDFMINLSASPFDINKVESRVLLVQQCSITLKAPVFYVNQVGANTDILFDGASIITNNKGELLKVGSVFKESFIISDIEDSVPSNIESVSREKRLFDALVVGIKDYFVKSGFNKAILGLSGGIDSALVAVLAVEALGKENVRCFLMPSEYSSDHSISDAVSLAENLGIQFDILPINSSYSQVLSDMSTYFENKPFNVAEENLQSRLRGMFLMAISNKHGYIVLNTTNKSEMAVGYGTLYGDMCGGISVIGDVYKTDVYKICKYLNDSGEIIPENILTKAPSAELRPNQKDTDSLPEYDVLDQVLYAYIEEHRSKKSLLNILPDKEIIEKVIGLVNKAEYKRYQSAPVLRVSTKAFGMGRNVPIVASFDF
tara:strand:- start:400 stop:2022 length:1623 start_codon:yes stop_codon:yes gene_type:complete